MDFGVCGWIDTVNGFNLPRVLFRKVVVFVPQLAWMLVFDHFWNFPIAHVVSKSDGCVEKVDG